MASSLIALLLLVADLEVANSALQVLARGFELLLDELRASVDCRFSRCDGHDSQRS